jgi:arabinose-5-phosphate isomerase
MADAQVGTKPVGSIMTSPCKSVSDRETVSTVLRLMHQMRINEMPVIDDAGRVVGLVDIQDLVA